MKLHFNSMTLLKCISNIFEYNDTFENNVIVIHTYINKFYQNRTKRSSESFSQFHS